MIGRTLRAAAGALILTAALACSGGEPRTPPSEADSGFEGVQQRGAVVMGVDQYASTHRFDKTPEGGRVELQTDAADSAAIATIRAHMRDIAARFAQGDFSPSRTVHAQDVPGTSVMAERRHAISYAARDLPRGAELVIRSSDPAAVAAIHRFMDFQRSDHRAGGADAVHQH